MNKFALLCFLALFSYGSNSDAQVYRTTDNRQLEGPSCPTGFWSQLTSSLRPCNNFQRAGNPTCISPLARCGFSHRFSGYFVGGGGSLRYGQARYPNEGVWGWDYVGGYRHWLRPKVALPWHHSSKSQGGTGAYKTDGPKIFPH